MTLGEFVEKKAIEAISVSINETQKDPFLCVPPKSPQPSTRLQPLVVFAEHRSGTNLFFDMLGAHSRLSEATKRRHPDVETLTLHELFAPYDTDHWRQVAEVKRKASKTCLLDDSKWVNPNSNSTSQASIYNTIDTVLGERLEEPEAVLGLLHQLPSFADKGYYAFKVFSQHLRKGALGGTPTRAVEMVQGIDQGSKFVILWRRRMIETFVSFELAKLTGKWVNFNSSMEAAPETVTLDRKDLQKFVDTEREYYLSIKHALEDKGLNFAVFEYGQDMQDAESQTSTIKRLERLLGHHGKSLADSAISHLKLAKQQQKELHDVVENWDEVVAWGYGGQVEEWEDLFA
ncbi:MAG: hypothetical protein SGILL_005450 [Bacillariaceae sp.]